MYCFHFFQVKMDEVKVKIKHGNIDLVDLVLFPTQKRLFWDR